MSKDQQFEELYRTYQPMVVQVCLGFMQGDRELAHDLSQEVFINAWNALDRFRGASSPKTWIYRITVNTCLQHIRRRVRSQRVPLPEVAAPPENPEAGTYPALYRAIGRLGELDRLVIMMVLDELTYEEITDVTGLAAGTLRVRIHRIKKSLKKYLTHEQAR